MRVLREIYSSNYVRGYFPSFLSLKSFVLLCFPKIYSRAEIHIGSKPSAQTFLSVLNLALDIGQADSGSSICYSLRGLLVMMASQALLLIEL